MSEVQKDLQRVANLIGLAYRNTDSQKKVLLVRQTVDIFLDKILELSSPATIAKLQNEAIKDFYKKKMIKNERL